jgi:hypothetical protein
MARRKVRKSGGEFCPKDTLELCDFVVGQAQIPARARLELKYITPGRREPGTKEESMSNPKAATCVIFAMVSLVGAYGQRWSDWSVPANLGPPVNTEFDELAPTITKDGLSLYFFSDRPGGFGGTDIWVSRRSSADDPWGPPQNLGPTVNTSSNELAPALSPDGHRLYFGSDRPGGFGGIDLYVSRRHNGRDDFDWRTPRNLGSDVNTAADEAGPAVFDNRATRTTTLYFHSNREGGLGGDDIYASIGAPNQAFGPAALVEELSSPFADRLPGIRRDGLEMFVTSNRPDTLGLLDLWVSTRAGTSDPWSTPQNLGPTVNSEDIEGHAALSVHNRMLYFHSTRPGGFGGFDLYVSTRTKLKEARPGN